MKKKIITLFCAVISAMMAFGQTSWVRVNQLGYLPNSKKVAVFISQENNGLTSFDLKDSKNNKTVFSGKVVSANAERWGMKEALRLD